jgi:hypothetical protein
MPNTSDSMKSRILKISATNLKLDILSASATPEKPEAPAPAGAWFSRC